MNKFYSLFILCFCFVSCSDKIETKDIISVDLENITQPSIYDIFSEISVIPLETTDESLIKRIKKVEYYKHKYYILDDRLHKILIFDNDGKYLYKIDKKGNGHDEYIDISDFYINKNTDQIVILSAGLNALIYYNNINGSFIKKIRLDKFGVAYQHLQYINNDTIAFWTSYYESRVKYYSIKKDTIVHEDYPEPEGRKDLFCRNAFMMDGFLSRSLTNTVYSLKNGKTEKAYTWDFGDENDLSDLILPKGFNLTAIRQYAKEIVESVTVNYVFQLHGQNDRYIYAKLMIKSKERDVFYDREKKTSLVFNKTSEGAMIFPITWSNNYIISVLESHITLEDLVPTKIRTPELSKIINDLDDNDNPVLIKHTFL